MNRATLILAIVFLSSVARAHYHELGWGEPYALAGKRIAFTTWYWVRPGQYDWVDDSGKSVFKDNNVMAEALDPKTHWKEIDTPQGVRLIVEKAAKSDFPVKPEHPWEADGIEIQSLLQLEDGKIMAWGTCKPAGANCLLESTDGGVTWTRPKLGLVEFNGSKENNLYSGPIPRVRFYDAAAPAEERFKMAMNEEVEPGSIDFEKYKQRRPYQRMAEELVPGKLQAIIGFTSPDGVNWKRLTEPLSLETSDGGQYITYDPKLKKYVLYLRSGMIGPRAAGFPVKHTDYHKFSYRRAIGRAESANFREFPLTETVVETMNDMAPTDTYYFCAYTTIPKAPDHHLMFPTRYVQATDSTTVDLHTSHDGKVWNRAGQSVLSPSLYGQWDGACVWTPNPGLVELGNGDWIIPYRGDVLPHKYPRGKLAVRWDAAIWSKGRLMAIEAPEAGEFATMAFLAPGKSVRINAVTARAGEIRVEAANFDGKAIAGRTFEDSIPIIGDQYQTIVRWKGADDLGVKAGEPVVLRFKMQRAKIYSLDFE